jgi:acetyl-CoA carboxylase carboxyltransferase component
MCTKTNHTIPRINSKMTMNHSFICSNVSDNKQIGSDQSEDECKCSDGSEEEQEKEGKSVVIGCGRLGGIPMGDIAVETGLVEQIIPTDPADANSREANLSQAGQVTFPRIFLQDCSGNS